MDAIQIHKGKRFYRPQSLVQSHNKVVVFDLDETLGSFVDLDTLWNARFMEYTQSNFNRLLDLYPEFLRTGILDIVEFLYYKKEAGACYRLYIYTNNQRDRKWTHMIIRYIEYKLDTPGLFDQVIGAFKINNVVMEPRRTSNEKSYSDLIKCSLLPSSSEICFIDDKYFRRMAKDRVYYIQPKPYHHSLTTRDIVDRFVNSDLSISRCSSNDLYSMFEYINETEKTEAEIELDRQVSKKMMYHLQLFFHMTTFRMKTRKIQNSGVRRFTRKRLSRG